MNTLIRSFLFQQQPVTEGYQYSQLSPSRSPSGPTYTQLSSGARTPAAPYHAVTTVPNNPGIYQRNWIEKERRNRVFRVPELTKYVNSLMIF